MEEIKKSLINEHNKKNLESSINLNLNKNIEQDLN